jgi:ATP-dependent DNA helicase RecG
VKPADLEILLQEGEGTTLELKEGLSASFARELVGMANTIGGRILLGVRDDGTVVGIADSNRLRGQIQDIARNCDPPVRVVVERVGDVLVVQVRESDAKPVQCGDGFFWRQGAATPKLTRTEIREFFRAEGAIRFDLAPCASFRYPQDFDPEKYAAWLRLSGITGQPRIEDVLVNIEAAERSGGSLLFRNAGALFFAREVRRFFSQAYVTSLLAKGTDKVEVLDRKDFAGGVVADIEDSLRFVERNSRTAWRIEGLRREDVPEYPTASLREAITNAVMHRDWFVDGANVFVELYSDRIEISSPGGLPRGMTLAELGKRSVRRNPLIADLLHRIGFIEKAGTGIRRIREEARSGGYPEPRFEANDFLTATFYPKAEARSAMEARVEDASAGQVTGQVTGQVIGQVTGQVQMLVQLLLRDEPSSAQQILERTGLSHRETLYQNYLRPALRAGLIERTIPEKPRSSKQRYRLTKKGKALAKTAKSRGD